MESLGVYISVPFCRTKCSYCNFASGVFPASYHAHYVDLVCASIRRSRELTGLAWAQIPSTVDSVYLGGGTPSVLDPLLLRRLFTVLREEFDFAPATEITLECAPGQIADDVLAAMVDVGVNRVSFGVQSFVDREAAVTGRLHTRADALKDIQRVGRAGIQSVSADLIAGLPHQTAESWRESLEVLISSAVGHASIYMLEVDEDSRLGRELLEGGGRYHAAAVPSDDQVADLYLEAVETLHRNSLMQYEISNFARPGAESVHNQKYWLRKPYLGFGLDAHSMLRTVDGGAVRLETVEHLEAFLAGAGWAGIHPVSRQQELEEAWFLGLRLNEGISIGALEREFGPDGTRVYAATLAELEGDGLLELPGNRVRLTEAGRLMSNEVFGRFLREEPVEAAALVLVD